MQTWLTLTGIGMDFLGFCILLREWWIAMFSEKADIAFEERIQDQKVMDEMTIKGTTGTMRETMEDSARARTRHVIEAARRERRKTLKSRRALFIISTVLIITGTGLQFVGAMPEDWFAAITDMLPKGT